LVVRSISVGQVAEQIFESVVPRQEDFLSPQKSTCVVEDIEAGPIHFAFVAEHLVSPCRLACRAPTMQHSWFSVKHSCAATILAHQEAGSGNSGDLLRDQQKKTPLLAGFASGDAEN
jgi:hypothetical protein